LASQSQSLQKDDGIICFSTIFHIFSQDFGKKHSFPSHSFSKVCHLAMEEEVVRKFQDVFLPGASYKPTQTATFRGGSWCDVERFAPIEINGTRTGKLHQTLDDSFGEFGLEGSFS
jgi:hypothetical protein